MWTLLLSLMLIVPGMFEFAIATALLAPAPVISQLLEVAVPILMMPAENPVVAKIAAAIPTLKVFFISIL